MLNRLLRSLLPVPVAMPLSVAPARSANGFKLLDILSDGLLWATPKRRTPVRIKWRERYGCDNTTHGLKLWKPKSNIVTCPECGDFHELANICRTCYSKVAKQTNEILLKETPDHPPRVWFAPNLAQPKAPSPSRPPPTPIKSDNIK